MTNPLVLASAYNKLPIKSDDGVVDVDFLTREHGKIEAALKFATSLAATVINVVDFGADPRGVRDSTAAIMAADAAACASRVVDGYVQWESVVYFPSGTYRVDSTVTYRGAPWVGEGTSATVIDYRGTGACVDAVGANGARKHLQIRSLKLTGRHAGTGAYGLRLGHNQRSFYALSDVRIDYFPAHGMLFDADTWIMGFYEVYLVFNGTGGTGYPAVGISGSVGNVNSIEWYNSVVENNGKSGSGVGGGIEGTGAINQMAFFGGTWEGNLGAAEMRFVGGQAILLDGVYVECDVPATGVDHGLVFSDCSAKVVGCRIHAVGGHTGTAVIANGTSRVSLDHNHVNANWPLARFADDTAIITVVSDADTSNDSTDVTNGAAILRLTPKIVAVADAATITVDAGAGTVFDVAALGGNRTIGAPTNPSVGQTITYLLTQDGTGGRTVTWNPVFVVNWSDTGNVAGAFASVMFTYTGTTWDQVGGVGWPGSGGGGGGSGNGVTVSVDFGGTFSQKAQTVVTGQSWVTAGSEIVAQPVTPAGTDPDEMFLLGMWAVVSDIVVGDGFTVTAYTEAEATGTYDIMCIGV